MRTVTFALALAFAVRADASGIRGVIQDNSGGSVESAIVTTIDEDTGMRRIARTEPDGAYLIAGLPAAVYRLSVRKPGFQTIVRWNVRVDPATDLRLDFVMLVGTMRSVITVEGSRPEMNTDNAAVGITVSGNAVLRLPLSGRGLLGILELAPGVVATPAANGEAGQFSAAGLRPNTNYFTVDGVGANTAVGGGGLPAQFAGNALPAMTAFGGAQSLVSAEAVDEVQVLTSSFAPEHGRLPGAQVALTSRSGTENVHGSAFYSLRNESLAANDWIANAAGIGRPPLRLNQWGATLGGPLRKNRTFAFASYEAMRLIQPFTRVMLTPSLEARRQVPENVQPLLNAFPAAPDRMSEGLLTPNTVAFSRPSRLDSAGLRIDHSISERLTAFGRYHRAPSSTESGFSQIEHFALRNTSVTLGLTATPTPAVTNDVRTNVWSTIAESTWTANPTTGGTTPDFAAFFHQPAGTTPSFYGLAIGGLGAIYSGQGGRNRQLQWNLLDTLAIRRDRHDIRAGIDYQRLAPSRETAATSVMGRSRSASDLIAGVPPAVLSVKAEQASALIETLSAFAQDTWSVTPRLNLTFGLRWELTPAPSMRQASAYSPQPGPPFGAGVTIAPAVSLTEELWRTRYTQFAPRIGMALRTGSSSVIRAGWGVFYDVAFSAALDPINGFPFNRWQFSGQGFTTLADAPQFGLRYAPDLRLPYVHQWNLAYERTIGAANQVSASYVGSSGHRLLRYEGVAQPGSEIAEYLLATNHGTSAFHALELQYRRRLARAFQGTFAYTWSHAIDNGSNDSAVYLAGAPSFADRGSSSFDVRQNFTAGAAYTLPRRRGFVGSFVSGVEVSAMLRARTGFPIDVLTTENLLGIGFDDLTRPDRVPNVPIWIPAAVLGGRQLNPAAFRRPAGAQGSLGRNAIAGAGMSQVDVALVRRFRLSGSAALSFRIEAYNLLNHPNAADPVRFLDSPLFGAPASMLNLMMGTGTTRSGLTPQFQNGGPRTFAFRLRFAF